LRTLDFPGYAIGGLAVGETKSEMYKTLDETCPALPADRPRYLMGVGAPDDIIEAVYRGVDMFDCVLPTRIARNAALLTPDGRINLRNAQYAEDPRPIQEDCGCYTCRTFSRAYLRHLYRAGEVTALRLGTIHNLQFLLELMRRIHQAIADDKLEDLRAEFTARYRIPNQEVRHEQRQRRKAAVLNQFGHGSPKSNP
jgi:queuine tRNA-ribosyltransferase